MVLCGSRDEAQDLVQEAFVRLAPRIGRLGDHEVGPYVRKIAVNLFRTRARRLRRERTLTGRPATAAYPSSPDAEERDTVWRAVLRLPPRQRACVVLRYYEDLTERDTASVLGCSLGTVKSQTSKALTKLRKELGDEH